MAIVPVNDNPWYLYVLLRSDLDSLNPGKAAAQVSHATSFFNLTIEDLKEKHANWALNDQEDLNSPKRERIFEGYEKWKNETIQGFGTCIVLDAYPNNDLLHTAIQNINDYDGIAGVVHDPTYPIRDGNFTHYVPLNTCAFVFIQRDSKLLEGYNLYK